MWPGGGLGCGPEEKGSGTLGGAIQYPGAGIPYRTSLPLPPGFQVTGSAGESLGGRARPRKGSGLEELLWRPWEEGQPYPVVGPLTSLLSKGCLATGEHFPLKVGGSAPGLLISSSRDTDSECHPSPCASQPGGRQHFLTRMHITGMLLPPGGCGVSGRSSLHGRAGQATDSRC